MAGYNQDDYENVKSRKLRFYKDFPDARINVQLVNQDLEEKAVVKAQVFLNREDHEKDLPRGEGFALEIRDKSLSQSRDGKKYASVNYTSWLENCEESAVGRALDNCGYASNMRCSAEEIQKAERNAKAIKANESPLQAKDLPLPQERYEQKQPATEWVPPNLSEGYPDDVIIPFGPDKGKKIGNLIPAQVKEGINYWRTREKKDGKPLTGKVRDYVVALEDKLRVLEQDKPPTEIREDDIPF